MRNPKLLTLLRQGCSIVFPSGFSIHMIPDSDFIESGYMDQETYIGIDTYDLSEEGLEYALDNEEFYAFRKLDNDNLRDEEQEMEM